MAESGIEAARPVDTRDEIQFRWPSMSIATTDRLQSCASDLMSRKVIRRSLEMRVNLSKESHD